LRALTVFIIDRAALALKCHFVSCETSSHEIPSEYIDKISEEIDEMEHVDISRYVEVEVTKQVIPLLAAVYEYQNMVSKRKELKRSAEKTELISLNQHLANQVKYFLECKTSSIEGAGEGVFIRAVSPHNAIPPGTVVALYPGFVHLKELLRDEKYFASLLPDPDLMLMSRIDQTLIDGRTAAMVPSNPYGLGHKINHCGAARRPNVMQVGFDYPEDWMGDKGVPLELRPLIPNMYAKKPGIMGKMEVGPFCCMRGLVLVSTLPLRDNEELLMDYRLDPTPEVAALLPEWYESYDVGNAKMRWGKELE
jgi:hypothetical protein